MTAYLADRIGARFSGRISGVTRFGLFVTLDDIGADGLIPISTLPQDFYDHDDAQNRLVGRDTGQTFTLGEAVQIHAQLRVVIEIRLGDPLQDARELLPAGGRQDAIDVAPPLP